MTGRRCYAMELSPAFVDVAVARLASLHRPHGQARDSGKKVGHMDSQTRRVKALDRHLQALELRKAGATYQAIAEQLGYATLGALTRRSRAP